MVPVLYCVPHPPGTVLSLSPGQPGQSRELCPVLLPAGGRAQPVGGLEGPGCALGRGPASQKALGLPEGEPQPGIPTCPGRSQTCGTSPRPCRRAPWNCQGTVCLPRGPALWHCWCLLLLVAGNCSGRAIAWVPRESWGGCLLHPSTAGGPALRFTGPSLILGAILPPLSPSRLASHRVPQLPGVLKAWGRAQTLVGSPPFVVIILKSGCPWAGAGATDSPAHRWPRAGVFWDEQAPTQCPPRPWAHCGAFLCAAGLGTGLSY